MHDCPVNKLQVFARLSHGEMRAADVQPTRYARTMIWFFERRSTTLETRNQIPTTWTHEYILERREPAGTLGEPDDGACGTR